LKKGLIWKWAGESEMDAENRQRIRTVLREYGLEAERIEAFGKMHKVYGKRGIFGLKETTEQKGRNMLRSLTVLYDKGFFHVVPVCLTRMGYPGVRFPGKFFYLLPWMEGKSGGQQGKTGDRMFRELGKMHHFTAREIPLDKRRAENDYLRAKERIEREKEELERFMDLCEQKTYLSPFEWIFTDYFFEIWQAYEFAAEKLERWFTETVSRGSLRSVLIHGRLSLDHFIFDERGTGRFINLEHSRRASPVFDLLPFFREILQTRDGEAFHWMNHYWKYFPWREEEQFLLQAGLACPHPLMKLVKAYSLPEKKMGEYDAAKGMMQEIRRLLHIKGFVLELEKGLPAGGTDAGDQGDPE